MGVELIFVYFINPRGLKYWWVDAKVSWILVLQVQLLQPRISSDKKLENFICGAVKYKWWQFMHLMLLTS